MGTDKEASAAEREALSEELGPKVRRARRAKGLTQEQTSEELGVSTEFYARVERGKALPSVPTFDRMIDVLDVEADILLGIFGPDGLEKGHWPTDAKDRDSKELRRLLRRLRTAPPEVIKTIEVLVNGIDRLVQKEE